MKVVRLSALRTGRLCHPGYIPGTYFCLRDGQPQGHFATGRIMSIINSNDAIGYRARDRPDYSAVPQSTEPPRTPLRFCKKETAISKSEFIYLAGCTMFTHLPAPSSPLCFRPPPIVSICPIFFL
jgi:hypothetical protein